jgi:hypothetical protein
MCGWWGGARAANARRASCHGAKDVGARSAQAALDAVGEQLRQRER